ncbi:7548_t:CDS:1, partial [Dentiscutata heterogama]
MLIPYSPQEFDLDEYDYDNFYSRHSDKELDSDNAHYDKNFAQ